jgi:hypothetical protein
MNANRTLIEGNDGLISRLAAAVSAEFISAFFFFFPISVLLASISGSPPSSTRTPSGRTE